MDGLVIEFGGGVPGEELRSLRDGLGGLEGVEDTVSMDTRGVDAATAMLWVQVAAGVIGAVGSALPVIRSVVEMVRGKGIRGAKIRLPNGVEISVDEATPQELERLIGAAGKATGV